jgi:CheY-like chemotaxis protein
MAGAVLVVEDEREIRGLLRRYLERAGLAVIRTGSGAEALRLLGTGEVNLVLLDLGLPDVDGAEVLHAARAGRRVPVVVLTARSAVEDRIRGLESSCVLGHTRPAVAWLVPLARVPRHSGGIERRVRPCAGCAGFPGGAVRLWRGAYRDRWAHDGQPITECSCLSQPGPRLIRR